MPDSASPAAILEAVYHAIIAGQPRESVVMPEGLTMHPADWATLLGVVTRQGVPLFNRPIPCLWDLPVRLDPETPVGLPAALRPHDA